MFPSVFSCPPDAFYRSRSGPQTPYSSGFFPPHVCHHRFPFFLYILTRHLLPPLYWTNIRRSVLLFSRYLFIREVHFFWDAACTGIACVKQSDKGKMVKNTAASLLNDFICSSLFPLLAAHNPFTLCIPANVRHHDARMNQAQEQTDGQS